MDVVFERNGVRLRASSRLELGVGDEKEVVELDFPEGEESEIQVKGLGVGSGRTAVIRREGWRVVREVFRPGDDDGRMAVRLRLENAGEGALEVGALTPIFVEGGGLALGDAPAGEWVFVRQPRYKNDMPASAVLGSESPAVFDATRGTQETGGWAPQREGVRFPTRFASSELTVLRHGGHSALFGLLPLDRQLVRCQLELTEEREKLRGFRVDCLCDGQRVMPGESLESQWVLVDAEPDSFAAIARYVESLKEMTGCVEQATRCVRPRPAVWCSWYYYGDLCTQAEAEENLEALQRRQVLFDVVQIDACWDVRWGDWKANEDWPDLKGFAGRVGKGGGVPGIWTCGFLAEPRSRTAYHHPEWLLRRRSGEPVRFSMNGMSNYVFDPTHPEVLDFLEKLYRWLTEEMGYTYHKIDFTRAVVYDAEAVYHDRSKNRAQAYRMGIEAIRRGIGEEAYLNICGGLYGVNIGLADAQRSGSDVKSIWPQAPAGEEAHGYGPFTIKQNTLRYWWNGIWDNDPDALMVRRRAERYRDQSLSLGLMSDTEAMSSTLNQYLGGGLVCSTENLAEVEDDRLYLLRYCTPSIQSAAIPRDGFEGKRFPSVFDTKVRPRAKGLEEWHTVSVVNWFDEERSFDLVIGEELLGGFAEGNEEFLVSAFQGKWTKRVRRGERVRLERIPAHGCEVVKVQALRGDRPALVRTDGHFSMGGTELVAWETEQNGVRFAVEWPWPVPLSLIVAPPAGRAFADRGIDEMVEGVVEGGSARAEFELGFGR